MRIVEAGFLGRHATFVPNKRLPVYNWFYFKEGFSRELVMFAIKKFNMKPIVLDPFCGSGTTLLVCKELGYDCIGYDVSPLCVFVSRAKTQDYRKERLEKIKEMLKKERFERQDMRSVDGWIRKFFNPHILEDVLFFRKVVEGIDGVERDFFKLALINAAMKCSYVFKDGSVLKVVKKPVPPFRKFFMRTVEKMIKDLSKLKFKTCNTRVEEMDARLMTLEDEISSVITSPPYLNKIEYTRVYRIEEHLFFGERLKKRGVRSYIGIDVKNKIEQMFDDVELPPEALVYLKDMKAVIERLYAACKTGGKVVMVVGNACFPDGVVECDVLLSRVAGDAGFDVRRIYVLNRRWCTKRRTIKVGTARESMIYMEK